MRTDRPRRRILRQAQALSQRGFLHRPDLSIDGFPHDHVSRAVRDPAHFRLDRTVGRNAPRSRAENCTAPPDLPWPRHAPLCPYRSARLGNTVSSFHTASLDALANLVPPAIVIL